MHACMRACIYICIYIYIYTYMYTHTHTHTHTHTGGAAAVCGVVVVGGAKYLNVPLFELLGIFHFFYFFSIFSMESLVFLIFFSLVCDWSGEVPVLELFGTFFLFFFGKNTFCGGCSEVLGNACCFWTFFSPLLFECSFCFLIFFACLFVYLFRGLLTHI